MYFNGEIVGQLKRPVIDNDFRSNISQGNEPEEIEITELEEGQLKWNIKQEIVYII